jgi:preprotein translocase subunit SecG
MTTFLAIAFVGLSITLAALAVNVSSGTQIDTSLRRGAPAGAPADPLNADPLAGVGGAPAAPAPVPAASTPPADDPLSGAAQ